MSFEIKREASSRENLEAPNINNPSLEPSLTPKNLAQGPAVKLCTTTVPIIIKNTKGTIELAPSKPTDSNLIANNDEIAAATIPRGATQLKNHFSFEVTLVPIPEIQMLNGRAINMTTSRTPKPPQPRSNIALESRRAASRMNNAEISSTVKVSLNSKISAISTPRIFANQIPITVTVSRPDSSCKILDATKIPSIIVNTAVLRK